VTRKQFIGLVGTIIALVILFLWSECAPLVLAGIRMPEADTAHRLGFAVQWLLVPGLTLLGGVWVAARRGFMPDAIDGTRTPASHGLEINLRYNQNTIEQTILATIAWTGLSLALPYHELYLIPAMAIAFATGRITFWIGYLIHPMARAFGMVLTVVPTIIALGWLSWRAIAGA
jgi:hypothetical protein